MPHSTTMVSRSSPMSPSRTSLGAAIVATASSVVRRGSTEQTIVRDGW